MNDKIFSTPIQYLKGIGPEKAKLLNKELNIFIFQDFLIYYPFRHEDRTTFYKINELHENLPYVQAYGTFTSFRLMGSHRAIRLVGIFKDDTASIEIVWFKRIQWIQKNLKTGIKYVLFGKVSRFANKLNIAHPEIELASEESNKKLYLHPVYHSTDKLRKKSMDNRFFVKTMKTLLKEVSSLIQETLPPYMVSRFKLKNRASAIVAIHFPKNEKELMDAKNRLKFEELFYIQLRLIFSKMIRLEKLSGITINQSNLLHVYYKNYLPFELTGAQKKVVKSIYADFKSGIQMNRLVQGDVGSGKTIIAFLSMLLTIGSGYQCAFMAPTEILAEQHFKNLKEQSKQMGLHITILTGSTPNAKRKLIDKGLTSGVINILVGTHALLEEKVKFDNLALVVIDEQHRFGVSQRAKLWKKSKNIYPHILVMTATPIPRTLAMTLYGDLDISIIDELPIGRKSINTQHYRESKRLTMLHLVKTEVQKGRQAYIVYPLIEQSDKMDYKDLMDGYESITRYFTGYPISILHGQMKSEIKDFEMQRFLKKETKIMVSTTVIEVGIDIPNATIMVIESAERFGLSQLHQLRGRVGRGTDQSYCILMTGNKLTEEARIRIRTMVDTGDGFEIAEVDLKLRGPGDLMGTRQSGDLELKIADLVKDGEILKVARIAAQEVFQKDKNLEMPEHKQIKSYLEEKHKKEISWDRIS